MTYECLENQKNEIKIKVKYSKKIPDSKQFAFKVWFSVEREGEIKRYSRIGDRDVHVQTEIYELDENIFSGVWLQIIIVFVNDNQEVRSNSTYKECKSCEIQVKNKLSNSTNINGMQLGNGGTSLLISVSTCSAVLILALIIATLLVTICFLRLHQRNLRKSAVDQSAMMDLESFPGYDANVKGL